MIDPGNSQEKRAMDEVAEPREQEQQAQTVDEDREQTISAGDQDSPEPAETDAPTRRRVKKRVKRMRQVTEEDLMPRPIPWPFALAISVSIMLGGFAINPIILGVGVILVIVSIIGWNLERR